MRPLHNDAGGAGAGGGRGGAEGRRRWGLVIARAVFRQKSETEWLLAFWNKIQTHKGSNLKVKGLLVPYDCNLFLKNK